jgi:predicted Na+-dependent transporter
MAEIQKFVLRSILALHIEFGLLPDYSTNNSRFIFLFCAQVFYIMFLLLFSYTLLFEYKYDYPENEAIPLEESFKSNASNGTVIATKGFTKIISKLKITGYEVILLIWILSLLAEEARQVCALFRRCFN